MYNNINQINAIYGKLFCVIWTVSFIKLVHTVVRTELQRVNRNITYIQYIHEAHASW